MSRGDRPRAGIARLAAAALALALAATGAQAAPNDASPMSLGDPHAPVTVIEYASVGCPHCAMWANEVFPEFRRKFVDTGKVRFELHEMLTGNGALAAAGFLLAHCAPPARYFQVVDDIFAQQAQIGQEGVAVLKRIGEHAGVSDAQFDACLQNPDALKALNERTLKDAQDHGVTGTPTFFVGDQKLDGEQTLEALGEAIARASPKAARR